MIDDFKASWNELTAPGAPFAWSVEEIRGAPVRVYDAAPPSMRVLWEASAAHGDAEYLVYGDERYSYDDIHACVRSLARRLRDDHAIGSGDRVAVSMRNYPEWVICYWAVTSLGAAIVGMNAWWAGPEMEYGLKDSSPRVLVVDRERLARVSPHLDAVRAERPLHLITVRDDEDLPSDACRWEDLVDPATAPAELPPATIDADDDACIFYTSGTTGFPKGAQLTHRGSVHNLMSIAFLQTCTTMARGRTARRNGIEPPAAAADAKQATVLLPVPLFHVTGCNCVLHPVSAVGGRIVLMHKWDVDEALRLIEREQVTNVTGVPTMARELISSPRWAETDTSSLESLGGGGAAVQPDLVEKIDRQLANGRPSTGYGLTETHGIITAAQSEYFVDRPESVGPTVPVMEARCIDPEGKVVATGELGELVVRGPNVIKGYLNLPDATAEAIVDGWFRTGDVALIDDDGFVHIRDRVKDMVIRGGENIHCGEVEAAIYQHPAIAEAAVFGLPDERLGEVVAAAIVLHPGRSLDEAALSDHLASRLARFKIPERVWFLGEPLPRNANGKFVKRELRERLAG